MSNLSLITLTEAQEKQLADFAPIYYSPKKLAKLVGIDRSLIDSFEAEYNNPKSNIYAIVEFARLKTEADINLAASTAAKKDSTKIKDLNRIVKNEARKELKKKLIPGFDPDAPKRGRLKYHPEYFQMIQDYVLKGGNIEAMPPHLKDHWERLKIVRDISNNLEVRAMGTSHIINMICASAECSESAAYALQREATSFFNISEPKNMWFERLLRDLDMIKLIALEDDNYDVFIKAVQMQYNINKDKKDALDIPSEFYEGRYMLISSHKPEDFGIAPVDREKLLAKIESWNLTKEEKEKVKKDAGI